MRYIIIYKTAAIPVVSGRCTRVAHINGAYKHGLHTSLVCIKAWFALKPDAESGLYAYKPGFYPRLYGCQMSKRNMREFQIS